MPDSISKPAYAELHPDDPIRENPFPLDHPGHQDWERATKLAEKELFTFQSKLADGRPTTLEESERWHIVRLVGTFDIWAKRGLCIVTDYSSAQDYRAWIESNVESEIKGIEGRIPSYVQLESFLPQVKLALLGVCRRLTAVAWELASRGEREDSETAELGQSSPLPSTGDQWLSGSATFVGPADQPSSNEPIGTPKVKRGRPRTTPNKHPEVERYLESISKIAGRPITILEFCLVSGFADDTIFGFWRMGDAKRCQPSHAKRFERTLTYPPEEFILRLKQSGSKRD